MSNYVVVAKEIVRRSNLFRVSIKATGTIPFWKSYLALKSTSGVVHNCGEEFFEAVKISSIISQSDPVTNIQSTTCCNIVQGRRLVRMRS